MRVHLAGAVVHRIRCIDCTLVFASDHSSSPAVRRRHSMAFSLYTCCIGANCRRRHLPAQSPVPLHGFFQKGALAFLEAVGARNRPRLRLQQRRRRKRPQCWPPFALISEALTAGVRLKNTALDERDPDQRERDTSVLTTCILYHGRLWNVSCARSFTPHVCGVNGVFVCLCCCPRACVSKKTQRKFDAPTRPTTPVVYCDCPCNLQECAPILQRLLSTYCLCHTASTHH